MTIYEFNVISTTGFPYFSTQISPIPEGAKIFLRFFDFSQDRIALHEQVDLKSKFDLTAGLISALYEFARNIDKKIEVLEFKPKKEKYFDNNKSKPKYVGDVLITTQTEPFLLHNSVYEKIKLIYKKIISSKIPLDSAKEISKDEREKIIEILTDKEAKNLVVKRKNKIKEIANDYLIEMKDYGLEGICITSFDLSPISVFGKKYSLEKTNQILRHIGFIPEITPLEWIYRQSFLVNEQIQVCIIKSSIGPTIEDELFEPYFYLLFADPLSYFGEFPEKLTTSFNNILG
jgi:hypothetical protein